MPSIFRLMRNAVACAFLAFALSACILSAKQPIYSDTDAKLVFTSTETVLTAFSFKNGAWVAEDEPMILKIEGQHYMATVEKSLVEVTFVPVEGNWYAVQTIEDKKTPLYTLVRDDKSELHVFPISCDGVKKLTNANDHVEFVKDNCFLKPGVDHKPLFSALSANPGADTLKLVPKS